MPADIKPADHARALAAWQSNDPAAAEAICRSLLEQNSADPAALRLLGVINYQAQRHTEALEYLSQVAEDPSDHSNLGAVYRALGRSADSEIAYATAIRLDPRCAAAHFNLGNLLTTQGKHLDAERSFRSAISCCQNYSEAWNGLGNVLLSQGRFHDAVTAFTSSARAAPSWIDPHTNLGVALLALGHDVEATQALQHAVKLDEQHVLAQGNLGAAHLRAGRPLAAEAASRVAIVLAPNEHRWHANLATALQMQGRHVEAEASYRRALVLQPDYPTGHGNLLFALSYRSDLSADAVFAEYRDWDRRHAAPLAPSAPLFRVDRTAGRRLRVGYVSADFRRHAVALFAEPLLTAHAHSEVELYCYSDVLAPDPVTTRFRALADHWRSSVGQSDAELAEVIRQDGIDVLVDLSGHSAGNRLLTFARRPAPVQVSYLLGHGYTSGLSVMDAFLADDVLAPEGADSLFSERLVRLRRIPFAYAPPAEMPAITPLPASSTGLVTFGYFGRTERLNSDVIATWAQILHLVPGSRLMLNSRPFQEPGFRKLIETQFALHSIDPIQLNLCYTIPQERTWAAYAEIDIALDPFPHNAGTTTVEALWQGVPVVSLAGRPSVGRFGASILHALSMDDWVTGDTESYVSRAVTAARNLDALKSIRSNLRCRFDHSPLCDPEGLARAFEQTFRNLWDEWRHTGQSQLRTRYQNGDKTGAETLARQILACEPDNPHAQHVLGLLAYSNGKLQEADLHLSTASTTITDCAELLANHAAVLRTLGRLSEAETAARRALALEPERVATFNNLGNVLRDAGRYNESVTCYQRAVQLAPRYTDAWVNLAWVLVLVGKVQLAEDAAREAIACDPGNADAHNNLGLTLTRQGRLAEAEAALRQALTLQPGSPLPHSNLLFCLNYSTELSAEEIFAEYQEWDRRHAAPLNPAEPQFAVERSSDRRLRIGYVSGDFRQHAVALFAEPLLAAHDPKSVELFCYAEVPAPDHVTTRFRSLVEHWCSTVGMQDRELAELIRRDKIDVLVDLGGHTAGNRLLAFARRPAPVQVTYLLGHGYTSGLSAMDAFLADPILAPVGTDTLFSERVIRLPRIPFAYAPPAEMPAVPSSPARTKGYVTFGYFGRTVRLNDLVIEAWAKILHAAPGSRLMLNNAPFAEPAGREQMSARFAARGIGRERLQLVHTTPQTATWAAYGAIDIALDPFPHNAGTTTIEALWQGVPVISLAGRPTVGRFGAAILHSIGLDDWVAENSEAYIARAVAAASDLAALARLRSELRERFRLSPLHNPIGLARELESVYRSLWENWRQKEIADLRQLYARGKLHDAARLAEQIIAATPSDASALHVLALVRFGQSDFTTAISLLTRALEVHPEADALSDLGVVFRATGRLAEAEAAYRRALELKPDLVQAMGNLGNVLLDQRQVVESERILSAAIKLAPDQAWLLRSLSLSLMALGNGKRAEGILRRILANEPDDSEAHEILATLLGQTGRPIEAEAHHRTALPGLRQRHRGLNNLGIALQMQGRQTESEACYREALAIRPDYATAHSNLLFALNYRNGITGEAVFAEYVHWDNQHALKLARVERHVVTEAQSVRRLRVGYVSADFRQHSAALFSEPLLAAHDRAGIELFCYADVAIADDTTARIRSNADHWRLTTALNDADLATLVTKDRIDILVDLGGHTAGNRLLAFARKPAPVQISYLLGHGYSSGLSAMDAFLADAILVPPGMEGVFSERVIRLDRAPLAYAPPAGMPEVSSLPAVANGYITFGYFGRPERLNGEVVAVWSRILLGTAGSKLILNNVCFQEPAFCELFASRFAAHGIPRKRLNFLYTKPLVHTWSSYSRIDIALDPFPHNAGTTTIEALWQGVPVLSLSGRPSVGRFGAMIMHSVGLDDWVRDNIEDYIARAVGAASNLDALTSLRAALRRQFTCSPLCDAAGLARKLEEVYRKLWEEWRAKALG